MNDAEKRLEWKNQRAQGSYGKTYASLCSTRKRIIDQLYELTKLEEEERLHPKKGCK